MVKVFDSIYHWKDNKGVLNYPTFVYKKDEVYPDVMQYDAPV